MLSNNVIVQTVAKCCYVSIVALCDVYKFTVKDLIDLPVYRVKDLIIHAEHVVHSAWILF